jgi:hypothetical protein
MPRVRLQTGLEPAPLPSSAELTDHRPEFETTVTMDRAADASTSMGTSDVRTGDPFIISCMSIQMYILVIHLCLQAQPLGLGVRFYSNRSGRFFGSYEISVPKF